MRPPNRGSPGLSRRSEPAGKGPDDAWQRWAMFTVSRRGIDDAPMLFDLDADIGESNDLATVELARLAELCVLAGAWENQLVPPRWGE